MRAFVGLTISPYCKADWRPPPVRQCVLQYVYIVNGNWPCVRWRASFRLTICPYCKEKLTLRSAGQGRLALQYAHIVNGNWTCAFLAHNVAWAVGHNRIITPGVLCWLKMLPRRPKKLPRQPKRLPGQPKKSPRRPKKPPRGPSWEVLGSKMETSWRPDFILSKNCLNPCK